MPIVRCELSAPGDRLHIDIKKPAHIHKPGHRFTGNPQDETRGAGWEFLYVAIDDHSRIAFTALLPDEKATSSGKSFLRQAVAYFAHLGISVRRVMTDNGPCLCSTLFAQACGDLHSDVPAPDLHSMHQWQGRTLHPNGHSRVGLRWSLPELRGTPSSSGSLDSPVKLA